ncbi:MFS transporter [Streptomyces sp. S186]|uniref:MFS transporter n=1 Tax=Streptomyces sp. S186 TaxID=3434395 RepID=UPI003F662F51
MPAALAIGAVSIGLSARLIARYGERAVVRAALVPLLTALALLTRLPVHAAYAVDLLPVILLVAGFGPALPALTALGMSGVDSRDAGLASGLFDTTQQLGSALGVAVLSTLAPPGPNPSRSRTVPVRKPSPPTTRSPSPSARDCSSWRYRPPWSSCGGPRRRQLLPSRQAYRSPVSGLRQPRPRFPTA